ncbi:MAG: hypothetical protein GQ534_00220 [Candidatus Delongbacteria bacterium]|nr:hypothetical protein [Candidatus Delongbacteria bacterium]
MDVNFIAMWQRDENNNWYNLNEIDFVQNDIDSFGFVYVIWDYSDTVKVLRVGQGPLSENLSKYKNDSEIMKYEDLGELKVTWAIFPTKLLNGIESFLSYKLNPLLSKKRPIDFLIPVNLPLEV